MKKNSIITALFLLFSLHLFSQTTWIKCGHDNEIITPPTPPQNISPPPSGCVSGANLLYNTPIFHPLNPSVSQFYVNPVWFYPDNNHQVIKIRVNLIIVQKDDGSGNFIQGNPIHDQLLTDMENEVNYRLANNIPSPPSCSGQLSRCHTIANTQHAKIQFVFNRVYIQDTYAWDNDNNSYTQGVPSKNYLNNLDGTINNDPLIPRGINVYLTQSSSNYAILMASCPPTSNKPIKGTWVSENADFTSTRNTARILLEDAYGGFLYNLNCDANGNVQNWQSAHRPFLIDFYAGGLYHEIMHQFSMWGHCDLCSDHVMGILGSGGRKYLSDQNLAEIQRVISYTHMSQFVVQEPSPANGLDGSVLPNYRTINTNTTINFTHRQWRDIVIEPGNTLTITCELIMPEDGSIIIKPGAKLVVDGGKITTESSKFWGGIQVWGDNTKDQSSDVNQGVLELKNGAIIEKAREAISVLEPNNWSSFGGIIRAEDAIFRNNRRSAAFMQYGFNNTSYFKRCTFELDANHLTETPGDFASHVTLWSNKGASFLGCTFRDNSGLNLFDTYNGKGIFSIDANYYVGPDCNSATPTSPCNGTFTKSIFENLTYGIHAVGSGTINTVTIEECDFVNNAIGTEINSLNNTRFILNNVQVGTSQKSGYPTDESQYGYGAISATDFEVEQNTFEKTGTFLSCQGVYVNESGENQNVIYKNEFKNLDIGQYFYGKNKHNLYSFKGLEFLCNSNPVSNTNDVTIDLDIFNPLNSLHGIRNYQGHSTVQGFAYSAENSFSNSPSGTNGHINNLSNNLINYYYNNGSIAPTLVTNNKVFTYSISSGNTCLSKYIPSEPNGRRGEIPEGYVDNYYSQLTTYNSLLYNYLQLIDGGNTEQLIQNINLTIPEEAQQLRNELMAEAPYLSMEALMDAANTGILSDAFLLEICLANPEATRNESFLDFVEYEIPNPLPANMVQLIYQNWDSETPRTLVENELAGVQSELGIMSSNILRHYKRDTIDHTDSIIKMYNNENTLVNKYNIAEILIEDNDFNSVDQLLIDIENNFDIGEYNQAEHDNFKDYIAIRKAINQSGQNILNLNESQLNTLRQIAELETGRSSNLAQNILCFAYAECVTSANSNSYRIKNKRVYDMNKPASITESSMVNVIPNPSTGIITINSNNLELNNVRLVVFDVLGKMVFNRRVVYKQQRLDLSSLEKGVYIYQVIQNDEDIIQKERLILN